MIYKFLQMLEIYLYSQLNLSLKIAYFTYFNIRKFKDENLVADCACKRSIN